MKHFIVAVVAALVLAGSAEAGIIKIAAKTTKFAAKVVYTGAKVAKKIIW